MGISPITNLIPLSIPRSLLADLEPLPMERAEGSPRTGDETYSPSGQSPPAAPRTTQPKTTSQSRIRRNLGLIQLRPFNPASRIGLLSPHQLFCLSVPGGLRPPSHYLELR